jgi:hypothetical protein
MIKQHYATYMEKNTYFIKFFGSSRFTCVDDIQLASYLNDCYIIRFSVIGSDIYNVCFLSDIEKIYSLQEFINMSCNPNE